MGGAKKLMQEHQEKIEMATAIAVKAGVLRTCELHDDVVFTGHEPIAEAFELISTFMKDNRFEEYFDDENEVRDLIAEAVEDHGGDSCYICMKHINE